jgi:hypothetical protein
MDVQGQQAQMLADQEAGMGSTAPTIAALQSNPNIPRQLDAAEYARRLPGIIAQAGPRAKLGNLEKILETQLKLAPTVSENAILDPLTKQPIGFLPQVRDGIAQQLSIDASGQITGSAVPLTGYQQARVATSVPQASQNMQLTNLPGGRIGAQVLPGALDAVQSLSASEALGKSQGELIEVTLQDGSKVQVPKSQFLPGGNQPRAAQPNVQPSGQAAPTAPTLPSATTGGIAGTPSAPSAAQIALNESYKPILTDAYAGYKLASGRSGTLQSLRNALSNPNFDTNAFTPAKVALTSFLNATGVTGQNANQFLKDASAFRQGLNTIASQSVSELPGAISNFELQFAQSRFGTLTDPKQANLYAIDLMEVSDKRKRDFYNFVQKNPRPDVIEAWQNSPQGSQGIFEDPKLRKYLPQRPVATGANKGKTAYNLPSGEWVVFD